MTPWNQADSARFRQYHQQTGGRLLQHLRDQVPLLLGTTIETVALEAKHKEGCERIIRAIENILADIPQADDSSSGSHTIM
jgi:hypothetical protein